MKTALLYARYSPRPDAKADNCPSVEVQAARIHAYCRFADLEPGEMYTDPLVSARKTYLDGRTGGRALLEAIGYTLPQFDSGGLRDVTGRPFVPIVSPRKPLFADVVVYDLSRVFRNIIDATSWLDRWADDGVRLHTAGGIMIDTSTADGSLVAGVQALFAAYMPRKTAERTSDALLHKQANGVCISGQPPYGWKRDPESAKHPISGLPSGMIAEPREQKAILLARDWKRDGASLREIGRKLTKAGYKPRGTMWRPDTVKLLLRARLEGEELPVG